VDWTPVVIALTGAIGGTFGVEALRQLGAARAQALVTKNQSRTVDLQIESRKLDEAVQTRDRLWQRVTDLETKIERMSTEHRTEIARLEAQVDDYQTKYVETNARLQVVLIEVETLRARVQSGAGTA
jgi:phage shock protein A